MPVSRENLADSRSILQGSPAATVWRAPVPLSPYFQGRKQLLKQLRRQLVAGRATALTQPQAIHGLVNVSRARVTQIMNLLNLAPDVQDALLCLPRVERGKNPVRERELRGIVVEADWGGNAV